MRDAADAIAAGAVSATWADLGLSGIQAVRDLWREKDLGVFEGRHAALVGRHGVALLRVSNAP